MKQSDEFEFVEVWTKGSSQKGRFYLLATSKTVATSPDLWKYPGIWGKLNDFFVEMVHISPDFKEKPHLWGKKLRKIPHKCKLL